MAAIIGIDGKVDYSTDGGSTWLSFPERNEFSINIKVDIAEHKPFVPSLADAWVEKARTWMSWSGSMAGYFDDADNTVFDTVVAGVAVNVRFYVSRASTEVWTGLAFVTSVDHQVNTSDFATLSADFEGSGALTREDVGV